MNTSPLRAGQAFPSIVLPLLSDGETDISTKTASGNWKLIVVYRGKHCPLCTRQLLELEALHNDFNEAGVDVIAVSADSKERAIAQLHEVNASYPVAYGLTEKHMKRLGLYISGPQNGTNVEGAFSEPGLFVVNQDGFLQLVDSSNAPFLRPALNNVLAGIKWLRSQTQSFPINGTHA